ncbi:sensor histidine kinase [Undibacterium fentianense]|uniref:histidine kinase n=1 Tax=Undibacterium fentianense TaxID=2828728 RepID=A0A941DZ44_9BURK|nr:ATP-binding protein [Undibacterium fentianense]MBR7800139.1 hypothetical protein [Undibacterium fentianense]
MSAQDFSVIAALCIHDVKNDLAQLAADAERRQDAIAQEMAMRSSETLTRLLCFYKSQTGQLHLELVDQAPQELVADLLAQHASHLRSRPHIRIETELALAPSVWFYDKILLQMLLANALQNALRFAKNKITIRVATVAQKDDPTKEGLQIQIEDDGAGFPATMLGQNQETLPTNSPITRDGTGLGLNLAREILKKHHNGNDCGQLDLFNRTSNGGAVFQITIP